MVHVPPAQQRRCTSTPSPTALGSGSSPSTTTSIAVQSRRRDPRPTRRAAAWSGWRSPACRDRRSSRRGNLMLTMDPPDHTRYRKLVNRGFTPRMIGALEPHIRELTSKIIDGVVERRRVRLRGRRRRRAAARGHRRAPRRAARGPPQDLRVEQPDDRQRGPRVHGHRGGGHRGAGRDVHVRAARSPTSAAQNPRDDIVTHAARQPRSTATRCRRWTSTCSSCCSSVAGNETTRNAISHGMHALLENPDQYAAARRTTRAASAAGDGGDPALGGPVMYFRRNATKDIELRGQHDQGRRQGQPSGTSRPTATRTCSTTRSRSTSRATRTRTSPSAAAARTSASAPTWPGWRSRCCSRSWHGGLAASKASVRPTVSAATSSAGSSISQCASTTPQNAAWTLTRVPRTRPSDRRSATGWRSRAWSGRSPTSTA